MTWKTPELKWNLIGCNQNGGLTHTVTEAVSYTHSVTKEEASEISKAISGGISIFGFGGSVDNTKVHMIIR